MSETRVTDARRIARAEASAWIVRLHGPHRTPDLEAGFQAWLAAHPENARQFERVTEVWEAGAVPVPGVPRVARDLEPDRPRRWLLASACASVVAIAGLWGVNSFWLAQNPNYTTGIAEQRTIRLDDGSRITLNSDSNVTVSYRRNERRIDISHGEALFDVAKDASRPFRVRAGHQSIEAIGTSFVVRREPRQLTVTLVEGKVAVSGVGGDEPDRTLVEGQRLRLYDGRVEIDEPRMEAVTAWTRGEVMLDSIRLADAIAEMNRYDRRQLVIDDPSMADVRVSGVYHIGDSAPFAHMVASLYGFEVRERGDRIHLARAHEPGDEAADAPADP